MPGAEAAASVIPAFVGLASTVMQSNANREAIREQNEYDYKKWREYVKEIDPSTQVRKMRAAGINPAVALSQGAIDSGNPSSAPPQSHVPQYDFSPMAQGFRDSVELYQNQTLRDSQIDNLNSQTENNNIRNRTQLQRDLMDMVKQYSEVDKNSKEGQLLWTNMKLVEKQIEAFDAQNSADLDLKKSQAAEHKAHASYLDSQTKYQNVINQFAPSERQKILRNYDASYAEILASAKDHNESAARNAAERALVNVRKEGVDISNEVADLIVDAQVDKAFAEADEAFYKSQNEAKGYYQGLPGKLVPQHMDLENGGTYHYSVPPSAHRKRRKKFKPIPNKHVPKYHVID